MLEFPERLNAAAALVDVHVAEGRGSKTAILSRPRKFTYADLHEHVNRLGNALKGLGIRMEERVAIILPDSPEWAFAFFAAIKIGAVAVPMNTILKPKDYSYLLNDSRARALIVDPSLLDRITEIHDELNYLEHILVTSDQVEDHLSLPKVMQDADPSLQAADTSKDDMAFWLYSSGTTGFPKGAVHLHHDMFVAADLYAKQTINLKESDVSFSAAKLFFAYGLGNGLYFPLRTGGTTVLLPERPLPDTVFDAIDRHQPTVFYSVPTSYAALLHTAEKTGRTSLGRIRVCVSAGVHIFISNRPGKVRAGSTGQIVPGYDAKIVDDHGRELPTGSVGTLLIKGDSIASGYWNKHEQTKESFFGEWINTHDKFSLDEDGYYWYSGRTDDMIKVSGQAVWPTDVEGILQQHPAVLESGVIGIADQEGLTKPRAYVVLKDGRVPSPELADELKGFVKNSTAPHKYPRSVIFVKDLPKTATGKIQRYKLREMAFRAE